MEMEIRGTHLEINDVYAPPSRTYPGDVHFDDIRVPVTHVFSWRAYVFSWRTYSGDVRVPGVRVLSTYVLYRRTCSIDVRILWTYVIPRRTYSGLRFWRFWDYAFRDRDSGQRIWRWIRDYAVGNRGFGTTQNILDFGSDEEDRRELIFQALD